MLLGRLSGGGEILHQLLHDVVVSRLLEVGQDDLLSIALSIRAALAHDPGRPQTEQLVPARIDLECRSWSRSNFFSKDFWRSSNVVMAAPGSSRRPGIWGRRRGLSGFREFRRSPHYLLFSGSAEADATVVKEVNGRGFVPAFQ
jgi:hypothetical protein